MISLLDYSFLNFIGDISESDSSDDDNDDKPPTHSSSLDMHQMNPFDDNPMAHHQGHSKKRLKTSHPQTTSTDAAALQLSEDEL